MTARANIHVQLGMYFTALMKSYYATTTKAAAWPLGYKRHGNEIHPLHSSIEYHACLELMQALFSKVDIYKS